MTVRTMRITPELSWLRGVSPKLGAHAAALLGYTFSDPRAIFLEIGYTQRGAKLKLVDYDVFYDATWGYDYVDVSLLGRTSLGPGYLLAGPTMGFRTACYTKIHSRSSCEMVDAV